MSLTSTQKTDINTVELEIAIGGQELRDAADKVFRRKVKTIAVPGFRKGKAPRGIIEKMYGEGVFLEDAVNDLFPEAFDAAVLEAGIEPVSRPDVEILTLDQETGCSFKAIVTVKPEVTIGTYKGIEAEKKIVTVSDEDADHELYHMRERNARQITVEDRAAQTGDIVRINFEGFVDGVPFDGGKAEDYRLTLGSGQFIPGFEEQVAGHGLDEEFDVNVAFPEEYHSEALKGKPALFKVKILEILSKEMPEADDEFARDVSEFDTLDELKADIRSKQQEQQDKRSQDELENTLIDKIAESVVGEIPDCMYENQMDDMVRDFEMRLSRQGMTLQLYMQYTGMDLETFRNGFREQAERQVKIGLALDKIVELENFEITEEEITAELQKLSEAYNGQISVEVLRERMPEKEVLSGIKRNRAIDLVRDTAVITETQVAAEESGHDHDHEH